MHKDKHLIRKQATFVLFALLVCAVMFMPAIVKAESSFLQHPGLDALKEGDVLLAPFGRRGAGVRMSFDTPVRDPAGSFMLSNHGLSQTSEATSGVSLYVVIPW